MRLSVITPLKTILDEEIDQLTLPTLDGEITILPNHVPLITKITPGEMLITKNRKAQSYAITGGFLEVNKDSVTILADYAVRAEDIEVAKAEQAKERAEKAMKEKTSQRDYAEADAILKRSLLELHVARKTRRSIPS